MRSRFLLLGIALAASLGAAGVRAEDGISATEIKIGMVNAQSGPASSLGVGMLEGARAVFKDINNKGGIHGRKINLVTADDGYEPEGAMEETLKMVQQQQVFALFGFVGTPTTNAVLPILREKEVPLVGAFTGAMTLRQPTSPYVFNVRASYDDETELLITRLYERGVRKVGVLYQFDGFGTAVLSGTERALQRRGLQVVAKANFARNTKQIGDALATLQAAAPEAIIMAGPYTPLAAFIKAARGSGLQSQLATVSFVGTEALLGLVGQDGNGVMISQVMPLPTDNLMPITRECRQLVRRYANADLGFVSLEGCVTARVLVMALERAGPEPTRQRLRDALESMKSLDVGGLAMSMSPDDHQAMRQVFLTQIVDGAVTTVNGSVRSKASPLAGR